MDLEEVDQEMAVARPPSLLLQRLTPLKVPPLMKPQRVLQMVMPVLTMTSLLMPEPGLLEGKQSPFFFFVCVPIMFSKSNLIVSFILICSENNIFGSSALWALKCRNNSFGPLFFWGHKLKL